MNRTRIVSASLWIALGTALGCTATQDDNPDIDAAELEDADGPGIDVDALLQDFHDRIESGEIVPDSEGTYVLGSNQHQEIELAFTAPHSHEESHDDPHDDAEHAARQRALSEFHASLHPQAIEQDDEVCRVGARHVQVKKEDGTFVAEDHQQIFWCYTRSTECYHYVSGFGVCNSYAGWATGQCTGVLTSTSPPAISSVFEHTKPKPGPGQYRFKTTWNSAVLNSGSLKGLKLVAVGENSIQTFSLPYPLIFNYSIYSLDDPFGPG